jgi:RNA 2',3'-cyclic 3'-phosphodiesterase
VSGARLRRGFLAIVPPPEVLDAIDALLERPKSSKFSWTRRDQWHVTLQFYGRVNDPETLADGIRAAAAASYPAQLVVRGGGAFPSPKKAQVFWLGIDGTDALIDLHATVAAATRDFIDRRDRITLKPHLTVARLKRTVDLTADVEALEGVPVGPPWTLTELVLLESDTKPSGAIYTEQGRFPLGT